MQGAGPDTNSVLRNSMDLIFLTLRVGLISENNVQASWSSVFGRSAVRAPALRLGAQLLAVLSLKSSGP